MNIEDFASKLIEKSKAEGATAADILVGKSEDVSTSIRLGKLEEIERSVNQGFGLRVFVGNKSASISSSKFDDADELVSRAVAMAKEATEDEYASLADSELLATKIEDLDLLDSKIPSEEQLLELAKEMEGTALENKGITNSDGAGASHSLYETLLLTSGGFSNKYESSHVGMSVSVIAGEGTDMQTDYEYSSKRHMADLGDPAKIGEVAARRAVAKLNPKKVPSGKYPVIYEPRMSKSIVADLAKGINGASVARGTSFLKNEMDEQIFAPHINIIDNPHIKRGLASKPYDGEGVQNKERKIIENGVLKTWLLDTRSANQLGLKTTGNASRGAGAPPSPSSTNFYMEAGDKTQQELIKSIKSGLLVTDTFGMGINYTTGDYSQGASGLWIEDGEIAYPVSEVTLAGNLLEMFKSIIPADDLEFKYGVNAPSILIPEMTLAGS